MTQQDSLATIRGNLKALLVTKLRLTGVAPESIGDDDPLHKGPLGLDSIDLLELALAVEQEYGFKVVDEDREVESLRSIRTLAEFVHASMVESAGSRAT